MVNDKKCQLYPKCGGCQLLEFEYSKTLEYKLSNVNQLFKEQKINHIIKDIIPSPINFKYRNKMILAFKKINGKIISGFYEEHSHQIVDLKKCIMHSDLQNEIAFGIKKIIEELRILPYDEDKKVGLVRYIIIKEAIKTKEILIVVVTASDMFLSRSEFVKRVKGLSNSIKSIVQNINPRKTSIVLGDKERILYGDGYINDELMGLKFPISSKSFYQVNPLQTEKLYQVVVDFAKINKNEIVIDAYSGVGTIGMILSSKAKEVISVENNRQAVNSAINFARINKIKNIRFICDDATNFLVELARNGTKVDILIMDPPRTGSTSQFLNSIVSLNPKKIIYVSCGPDTLARDLNILCKKDYKIIKSCCVDMFCWTKHVETIMLLCRKESKNK